MKDKEASIVKDVLIFLRILKITNHLHITARFQCPGEF